LLPPTAPPGAIPTPRSALSCRALGPLSLSRFSSSMRHRAPPPHFPLLFSPARPLIWRRHRCLTPLGSASIPELELPPSPLPTRLPRQLPPPETPPPLWFPSECHRLRRFTVRPSHPPLLSPIEAALTFPLLHQHCRVVPPSPPATGALSPPTNTAVPRLLPHLCAATPFR
jgi:hypothetical protein